MANAMRSLADHLQPLHISVTTTHSGTYRQPLHISVTTTHSGTYRQPLHISVTTTHSGTYRQPLHISVTTTHSGTYRQVVFGAVLWGIRIQLFISLRIRIQVAKPMQIHPDTDPG
jgi:hypothetical protein